MDADEFIKDLIASTKKKFGDESVHSITGNDVVEVEVVRTGVPELDVALGVGGLPRGRVIEVFGPESSGKTTLALKVIAMAQRAGGVGALVDTENAFDPEWAEKIGVDLDRLVVSQPDNGEQALEIYDHFIEEDVEVVVMDSVAAMVPKAELEGDYGQSHVGLQARMMSQALRKLTHKIKKRNALCIFINQIRSKIGVQYGNPNVTTGGMALRFYSSIRLEVNKLSPKEDDKIGENVVTQPVKIKVVKNKVAPPFKVCTAKIDLEDGFSLATNIFEALLATEVIEKSGNTYYLDGEKLAVGKNNARLALKDIDEDGLNELYDKVIKSLKGDDDDDDDLKQLQERIEQTEKKIAEKQEQDKDTSKLEKRLAKLQKKVAEATED